MKQAIYDDLVSVLYPVPECGNCEYNFTRFSSNKCFKCDGVSCYRLAEGIQSDVRKIVRGIVKIVKENGTEEVKTR